MNWLKSVWKRLTAPQPSAPRITLQPRSATAQRPSPRVFSEDNLSNLTPRAQQVLALSRKEAERFQHGFVGTEHLLLGLIALGQGTAVQVLRNLGLDLEAVRLEVEKQVGTGPDLKMIGNIPYTPRVKKVLAFAAKEARELNHSYVGTEHLLLGLLREGDGVAARVLKNLEVDIEHTREMILKELDPGYQASAPGGSNPPSAAVSSSSRTTSSPSTIPSSPGGEPVDVSKRYDVYCTDWSQGVVVYRNARFKGLKHLFQKSQHDVLSAYVELEQPDGPSVYVSRSSIIRFCEHGVSPQP